MQSSPARPRRSLADAALADSWRARVDDLTGRAVAALSGGRHERAARLLRRDRRLGGPQRAYQARCRLAELALAVPAAADRAVAAASSSPPPRRLLGALEREPREPVLLNFAGILLYELTEARAAAAAVRGRARLDPSSPHVAATSTRRAPLARR